MDVHGVLTRVCHHRSRKRKQVTVELRSEPQMTTAGHWARQYDADVGVPLQSKDKFRSGELFVRVTNESNGIRVLFCYVGNTALFSIAV